MSILPLSLRYQYLKVASKNDLRQALVAFMQQQGDQGEATELKAPTRQVDYLKKLPAENTKSPE